MSLDLVIRGGTVYDGSGKGPEVADVAVKDGKIAEVGRIAARAARELAADGLAVTPGFIDIHSHSDYTLLVDPRAVSQITQGVTLEVIGNCGFGCAPIRNIELSRGNIYGIDDRVPLEWRSIGGYLERLEKAKPAVNVMTLVPNGQLRLAAIGLSGRAANPAEQAEMRDLLQEGMGEGAHGLSIGLEYPAEQGAGEEELTDLAAAVGRAGGIFAAHTRYRGEGAEAAVAEAIRIGEKAEVRLQVSHLIPRAGLEVGRRTIAQVERAQAKGQDIAFDMHTRLYGTTMLSTLLPAWAAAEGKEALARNLASGEARAKMKQAPGIIASVGDWSRVILLDLPSMRQYSRRSLAEIAAERDQDPFDAAFDILAQEIDTLHRAMVLLMVYSEDQQREAFAHPLCMPGSDATALAPDGPLAGQVFHGAYTWASWFWRFMVREGRALAPEAAIHKLTGQPAAILGLSDRGRLAAGGRADIAVFDPREFGERATTFEPNQIARGMRHVVVNGVPTLVDATFTGERAGAVIRRRGPAMQF
ncbi:MAG: amidohydrolase family protein [Proteobacteria bacterium]|nr:amidohydrolase family protein [Pseudomonadota bacterium]